MDLEQPSEGKHVRDAFLEISKKDYARAEEILNEGLGLAEKDDNRALMAVFYSTLGVLSKLQHDFRKAWHFYDQAEKCLPDHPVLKLISARLLIEVFSQYDVAIRKMKKIETMTIKDPLIVHQMDAVYGYAYAKQGNKGQSRIYLERLLANNFKDMVDASNIDFKLVEICTRKGWHLDLCERYLQRAIAFSDARKETSYSRLFRRLLEAFQKEKSL